MNACRRLGYQQYVLGRQPPKKGHALITGSAWHAMQEVSGKGGTDAEIEAACDAHIPEFVDDKYGRTRDRYKEAFEKYRLYYQDIDAITEVVETELSLNPKPAWVLASRGRIPRADWSLSRRRLPGLGNSH